MSKLDFEKDKLKTQIYWALKHGGEYGKLLYLIAVTDYYEALERIQE